MHSGGEVSDLLGVLYYITTALARGLAVGSGESRDDCQRNSKIKEQKVRPSLSEESSLCSPLSRSLINLASYSAPGRLTHRRNATRRVCHADQGPLTSRGAAGERLVSGLQYSPYKGQLLQREASMGLAA